MAGNIRLLVAFVRSGGWVTEKAGGGTAGGGTDGGVGTNGGRALKGTAALPTESTLGSAFGGMTRPATLGVGCIKEMRPRTAYTLGTPGELGGVHPSPLAALV